MPSRLQHGHRASYLGRWSRLASYLRIEERELEAGAAEPALDVDLLRAVAFGL